MCEKVHEMVKEITAKIRSLKLELKARGGNKFEPFKKEPPTKKKQLSSYLLIIFWK